MTPFSCRQCGACCKQPGFVYLAEGDSERLAKALEVDVYAFTEQYGILLDRKHLALRKHQNESCVFLTSDACAVYDARPRQCRDFPVGWQTPRSLGYCKGLKDSKA